MAGAYRLPAQTSAANTSTDVTSPTSTCIRLRHGIAGSLARWQRGPRRKGSTRRGSKRLKVLVMLPLSIFVMGGTDEVPGYSHHDCILSGRVRIPVAAMLPDPREEPPIIEARNKKRRRR